MLTDVFELQRQYQPARAERAEELEFLEGSEPLDAQDVAKLQEAKRLHQRIRSLVTPSPVARPA